MNPTFLTLFNILKSFLPKKLADSVSKIIQVVLQKEASRRSRIVTSQAHKSEAVNICLVFRINFFSGGGGLGGGGRDFLESHITIAKRLYVCLHIFDSLENFPKDLPIGHMP